MKGFFLQWRGDQVQGRGLDQGVSSTHGAYSFSTHRRNWPDLETLCIQLLRMAVRHYNFFIERRHPMLDMQITVLRGHLLLFVALNVDFASPLRGEVADPNWAA